MASEASLPLRRFPLQDCVLTLLTPDPMPSHAWDFGILFSQVRGGVTRPKTGKISHTEMGVWGKYLPEEGVTHPPEARNLSTEVDRVLEEGGGGASLKTGGSSTRASAPGRAPARACTTPTLGRQCAPMPVAVGCHPPTYPCPTECERWLAIRASRAWLNPTIPLDNGLFIRCLASSHTQYRAL